MFVTEGGSRFVIPRTELTYPCHVLKMHENAAKASVDHVMADFEDACPYDFKGQASRDVMVEALNSVGIRETENQMYLIDKHKSVYDEDGNPRTVLFADD